MTFGVELEVSQVKEKGPRTRIGARPTLAQRKHYKKYRQVNLCCKEPTITTHPAQHYWNS